MTIEQVYLDLREFSRRLDAERASKGMQPLVFATARQQPRLRPPFQGYIMDGRRRQEDSKHRALQQQPRQDILIVDYVTRLPKGTS